MNGFKSDHSLPSRRAQSSRHIRFVRLHACAALATLCFFAMLCAPDLVAQQFRDISVKAGLHRDLTRSWGNPLWGDFNNDGLLDLLVSNHEAPSGVLEGGHYPYIYINNGNGTFTDVIDSSGIVEQEPDTGAWQGISIGDYNGDGNLDIMITEPPFQGGDFNMTRNLLFKGHGDATWEYASEAAGIVTSRDYGECSFFVDYDNDGQLDIFVKNIPNRVGEAADNVLYHNNGDGTFSVVPDAGGLAKASRGATDGSICSFADYDNDGFMDVAFSGNDSLEALYHNNRDGTFSDVTSSSGMLALSDSQGLAWGDYNNDGLLDLYVSRGTSNGLGILNNTLYRNNGDGTFTDATAESGTNDNTSTWAAIWGDYDNDGFLDLFVARSGTRKIGPGNANILYHNNGDGTFTDVAAQEGVALQDNKATAAHKLAAWGDYNNDGFLDLAIKDGIGPNLTTGDSFKGLHYLFKNNGNGNHSVKLYLRGVQSNLNGIGARVTVTHGGAIAYRQNNGGGGGEWGSQGAGPLHFGVGSATAASLRIDWPSGQSDVLPSVPVDTSVTVVEGNPSPTPTPTPSPTPGFPVITKQPADRVVVEGGKATFRVIATGTPPLTYQWRKNSSEIAGATADVYKTPPTTAADNGSRFSVVVTSNGSSVISRKAGLTVNPAIARPDNSSRVKYGQLGRFIDE